MISVNQWKLPIPVDKHSTSQHGTIIQSKHGNLMCDIYDSGLLLFTIVWYPSNIILHSWDSSSSPKEDKLKDTIYMIYY